MKRDSIEIWYPESRFGGFTDVDGTVLFYSRVRSLVTSESVVLDVGCGRAAHSDDPVAYRRDLRKLRGHVRRVIGIDVDPASTENPWIDEFRPIAADGSFPVDTASCDVLVSDSVLEHVPNPTRFFSECSRVLRPGGVLALRTTNALGYVGLGSRLIPQRLHAQFLSRAQDEIEAEDYFPTVYACNTRRRLKNALERAGFECVVYSVDSEPRYFLFSRLLYALAVFHQRYSPAGLRLALFAFGRKRAFG